MKKTAKQIERDVFMDAKGVLSGRIKGAVYRKGMRPKDSRKEDAIVYFLSGAGSQFQEGEVGVNVYVPYAIISSKSNPVPDIGRIDEIEALMYELEKALDRIPEYNYSMRAIPDDINDDDIQQSVVTAIIKFKRTTL